MTERASFFRKIGYGVAIAILAVGMMWLSAPATVTKDGGRKPGGRLAELRDQYRLAQINLGEVDPASETIKLATLGLRGVAVNLLWEKANYYKKVEDWTNLTATLEQLAKLQPNFIIFWQFQAWNLTYNVSVEFDDYHDRYYYVRRGIEFLKEGERYNVDHPRLLWDLGWFIGQKIGRADEYVQYRKLFKEDDDFHPPELTLEERDNWLVGRGWYEKAIDAVDNKGHSLGRKSPRDFYSSPAKSQMNYAEAIEEEGAFEKARRAWIQAAQDWRDFGEVIIEHSTGVRLQLGSQKELEKQLAETQAKLDAMSPGLRDKLAEERRAALTTEEREILDTPLEKLTADQSQKRYDLEPKLRVTDRDVAERIAEQHPDKANEAMQLASEAERQDLRLRYTINYKRDANYDYWQTRADFEQTQNALDAREAMFEARKAFENADLPLAKKLYQEGFEKWKLVIDEFPTVLDEEANIGEDILEYIKKYRDVLDQLDEPLGDDFPLWNVIEKFDREQNFVDELKDYHERHPESSAAGTATPATPAPAESAQPEEPAATTPATDAAPAEAPAAETPAETTPASETPATDAPAADAAAEKASETPPAPETPASPQ